MAKFDGYEIIKNKSKVRASRCFMILWYFDSTNARKMKRWCQAQHGLKGYYTVIHNKGGKARVYAEHDKTHAHTVFWLKNERTFEEVARLLVRTECPAVQPVNPNGVKIIEMYGDVRDAFRYILHLDQDDKEQGLTVWNAITDDPENKIPVWSSAPVYSSKAKERKNEDDDRNSISMVALADFIEDNCIMTFTQLIRAISNDAMMLRFVRENVALTRELIKDSKENIVKVLTEQEAKYQRERNVEQLKVTEFLAPLLRMNNDVRCKLPDGSKVTLTKALEFYEKKRKVPIMVQSTEK